MQRHLNRWILALLMVVALPACAPLSMHSPSGHSQSKPLSVLYAGSMTKVMEDSIQVDVQKKNGWSFQGQAGGSRALAQMIDSGLRSPDVFISASPTVNNQLLMGGAHPRANWYITLARDEMVIAYSPKSRFVSALQSAKAGQTPWYDVLQSPGFLLGRTDPKLDPKGVNALLTMNLASAFYHQPALSSKVLGAIENQNQVFPEETLLSRVETGQLDAVFAYRHEAVEWGLPYISLPPEINLGDPAHAPAYKAASVQVGNLTEKGAPIVFTVTIPNQAPHPETAAAFVQYLLTGRGHTLLLQHGYGDYPPELAGNKESLPSSLQSLLKGNWDGAGGQHP